MLCGRVVVKGLQWRRHRLPHTVPHVKLSSFLSGTYKHRSVESTVTVKWMYSMVHPAYIIPTTAVCVLPGDSSIAQGGSVCWRRLTDPDYLSGSWTPSVVDNTITIFSPSANGGSVRVTLTFSLHHRTPVGPRGELCSSSVQI